MTSWQRLILAGRLSTNFDVRTIKRWLRCGSKTFERTIFSCSDDTVAVSYAASLSNIWWAKLTLWRFPVIINNYNDRLAGTPSSTWTRRSKSTEGTRKRSVSEGDGSRSQVSSVNRQPLNRLREYINYYTTSVHSSGSCTVCQLHSFRQLLSARQMRASGEFKVDWRTHRTWITSQILHWHCLH